MEDAHRLWATDAFALLVGADGCLTQERLSARPVASWFRALITDMVVHGTLPPTKALRTSRIIALLCSKASMNQNGCFSLDEFDACTRVITSPSEGCRLEEELVWCLLNVDGRPRIVCAEAVGEIRALWASMGITCSDEGAQKVVDASVVEDHGTLTAERYREWFESCSKPIRMETSAPASIRGTSARGWAQHEHSFLSRSRCAHPRDHMLRSAEVEMMSLFRYDGDQALDLSSHVRQPLPAKTTARKRPGSGGRAQKEMAPSTVEPEWTPRPRLPKPKPISWEEQQRWWDQKSKRLIPYMRVKASYSRPDGKKVSTTGVLLSGWGVPNEATKIPHSQPPESMLMQRKAKIVHPGLTQAQRRQDRRVLVLVDGSERLLPRSAVEPILEE
mmetsp:Transcript_75642/g.146203  ORF Transcript_75642/g.146203 Transcript_75642/m.146203 type:complete len:389 (-) Transcript_75642:141-1307(-)